MHSFRSAFVLMLVFSAALQQGSLLAQDWERANTATTRLMPAAFSDLPPPVRQDLERRGCKIPQTVWKKTPHNVIRGRFISVFQTDIALLCSKAQISTILVFRNGTTPAVAELATRPDQDFLQVVAPGNVVGYSRALGVADSAFINKHYAEDGRSRLPPVDHDGITDRFIEKGSVIWYWDGGRWLQVQGAE